MEEDRSALFNQLKNFSQRKLKKVETKVVTGTGEQLVEKRGAKGLQVLSGGGGGAGEQAAAEPARKLDLQVGFILPGLLIGSQDVAFDKSSLDSYGITHILNLDSNIENKFEEDYNYKNVNMLDRPEFELDKVLDDCFEFIDDGRHYGNVFVHCSGTIGLSRSTTICVAYLMNKEKQKFDEAFNNVKEARSFVKPNEGFTKQLREYETKLRGAQQVKDSGIDDPFALRKKQEIEKEKAMVAGAASVKNRMKMFGATLDTNSASASSRSKSVSPSPQSAGGTSATPSSKPAPSKWSSQLADRTAEKTISKSMTPEPRRSWQTGESKRGDWGQAATSTPAAAAGPPPPPPPMPISSPLDRPKSGGAPPPPPPPPPAGDLMAAPKRQAAATRPPTSTSVSERRPSSSSTHADSGDDEAKQKLVFGRRPPPPMKLRGGLSIERRDETSDRNLGLSTPNGLGNTNGKLGPLGQRCPSPLVLMNNVSQPPSPQVGTRAESHEDRRPKENPFKYWQQTTCEKSSSPAPFGGDAPKRTVSLGPRRAAGELAQKSPFLRQQQQPNAAAVAARNEHERRFERAANELQSSLTELDKLIDEPRPRQQLPPRPVAAERSQLPTINTNGDECSPQETAPRWQWQDDLTNWKMSSSVNDLRSAFEGPAKQNQLMAPRNKSSLSVCSAADLPPSPSRSANVLRNSPWHASTNSNANSTSGDYTIRRTTSTSSSAANRPVIRNPYRGHY